MALRLFDTARRGIVDFAPGPMVRMYVCGITPYDATHLGHAATYITYDLLIRRLEDLGHEVALVRNVTDVDDSILPKAKALGVNYLELAEAELTRFRNDMEALGMRPPVSEPRATEAVPEIIDLVGRLLASGHAYVAAGNVFFDVTTSAGFGQLSGYSRSEMLALAAERGGRPDDQTKRDPLDFALWQRSAPDEPSWEAAFGAGRPGWHIECSAMALSAHGATLDLHGGGTDLIFPHHECEIAQSRAITGEPLARCWVHSAMVAYEGEKMSKSLGNLVFVSDLLKVADPRAIRLALMRHHYRAGFEWHDRDLDEGRALLHRLLAASGRGGEPGGAGSVNSGGTPVPPGNSGGTPVPPGNSGGTPVPTGSGVDPRPFVATVREALDDDLDVPRALEGLDDLASAILSVAPDPAHTRFLVDLGALLGVDLAEPLRAGR